MSYFLCLPVYNALVSLIFVIIYSKLTDNWETRRLPVPKHFLIHMQNRGGAEIFSWLNRREADFF